MVVMTVVVIRRSLSDSGDDENDETSPSPPSRQERFMPLTWMPPNGSRDRYSYD